jgi:hypothetical protein
MSETLLDIAQATSRTPLGRRHQHALRRGAVRQPKPIPFDAFERERYPEPALGLARDFFVGLARGEYGAIAQFSLLSTALTLNGAPLDLILAATHASSDEARHTEYCLKMAEVSGQPTPIQLARATLDAGLPATLELEDVDLAMLRYVAVSETLATALLTACRNQASDPVVRALLTALVADEVHHARLGWYYAAYRSPAWSQAERQRLADQMAEVVVGLEQEFWQGRDAPCGFEEPARALGLLDSVTQRAVINEVMESEILPALDALGFNSSKAWQLRPTPAPCD